MCASFRLVQPPGRLTRSASRAKALIGDWPKWPSDSDAGQRPEEGNHGTSWESARLIVSFGSGEEIRTATAQMNARLPPLVVSRFSLISRCTHHSPPTMDC